MHRAKHVSSPYPSPESGAFEEDEEVKIFDSNLEKHTTHVINNLVGKSSGSAGSLKSLTLVIQCLGDTNKEAIRVFSASKKKITTSQELHDLLKEYFKYSQKTLDFFNILEVWLQNANHRLKLTKSALDAFKEDKSGFGSGQAILKKRLKEFMEANDVVLIKVDLAGFLEEQNRVLEVLEAKKRQLDRKLVLCKIYRKVLRVIIASASVGLMICSLVAAVLLPAESETDEILGAAAAVTGFAKKGLDYVWDKYEDKVRRREELVKEVMEAKRSFTVQEFETTRVLVEKLHDLIQSMNPGPSVRKDPTVKSIVEELEKTINVFTKESEHLKSKKDKCHNKVIKDRAKILGSS